jgi:outer membrane protein TolC
MLGFADAAPLAWDQVTFSAVDAWKAGPGAAARAEIEAAEQARSRAAPPPSFTAMTRLGYPGQDEVQADLSVPLRFGGSQAAVWTTTAERRAAYARLDLAAFVAQTQTAYLGWWEASEVEEHLRVWSAEVDADLARLQSAADAGLIAKFEVDDLRAELATVRAEIADARARARTAEANLETWLGPVELAPPDESHRLHDVRLERNNPWLRLDVGHDPRMAVATTEAALGQAEARAVGAWPVEVSLAGAAVSTGVEPAWVPMGGLSITAPFRSPGAAEAADARGRAQAATIRADYLRTYLSGERDAEAAAWEALLAQVHDLRTQVVAPLRDRLARVEDAWKAGLIAVDRVIRARRDHHEAEHSLLTVVAALLASEARAEARIFLYKEGP